MSGARWLPLLAVLERELIKLARQPGRLAAQMVRPLVWLFVIGGGLGAVMSRQGAPGYGDFLVPGVLGMAMLFGAMLGALSTVYDKESGVMRLLVIAPIPHAHVVIAKILAAAASALLQGAVLLLVLAALGRIPGLASLPMLAAGMAATALACASTGMAVATFSRTLDNYAVMMNVVIFPMYFVSGALYPLAMLPPVFRAAALANPFTYGVDIMKRAMGGAGGPFHGADLGVALDGAVAACFIVALATVACARFSRPAACEPLVHPHAGQP